jgi:hypothetical protein
MLSGRFASSGGRINQRPARIAPRTFFPRIGRGSLLQNTRARWIQTAPGQHRSSITPHASRKRDPSCADVFDGIILRACSAVEVFDFFHNAGLATHSQRHHCLTALRRDNRRSRRAANPIE